MSNWKERLKKNYIEDGGEIASFIETEIIKQMIADLELNPIMGVDKVKEYTLMYWIEQKQKQLRAKWLGEKTNV